jgi:hypothetical protein
MKSVKKLVFNLSNAVLHVCNLLIDHTLLLKSLLGLSLTLQKHQFCSQVWQLSS